MSYCRFPTTNDFGPELPSNWRRSSTPPCRAMMSSQPRSNSTWALARSVDQFLEAVADLLELRGSPWYIQAVVVGSSSRMPLTCSPCGQGQREPREVLGHHVVRVPPRLVIGERLRMVAFSGTADGDVGEVLVERVDAQHVEPVADPLHVLEPQVPAAGAVGFAERPLAAQLVGHAGQFQDGPDVAELGVHVLAVVGSSACRWPGAGARRTWPCCRRRARRRASRAPSSGR